MGKEPVELVDLKRHKALALRCRGMPYEAIAAEMGLSYRAAWRHVQKSLTTVLGTLGVDARSALLELDETYRLKEQSVWKVWESSVEAKSPDYAAFDAAVAVQNKRLELWRSLLPTEQTSSLTASVKMEGGPAELAATLKAMFAGLKAPEQPASAGEVLEIQSVPVTPESQERIQGVNDTQPPQQEP